MRIRELHSDSELGAIAGDWQRLWEKTSGRHIEQHPAWGKLAARESNSSLSVVSLENDAGSPVALAPILVRPWSWRFRLGYKSLFGLPVTLADLCGDRFVAEDEDAASEDLLRALARSAIPFDMIYFESLPTGSSLHRIVTQSDDIKKAFWTYVPSGNSTHWRIRMPESFDAYLAKFGGKTRRKLTAAVRKLEAECKNGMRIVRVSRRADVEDFLKHVEALSKQSWQGTKLEQVVTSDARTQAAYEERADLGWLRCYLLMNGNEAVAFVIGSQAAGTYYYERIGYDPKWTTFSPGKVLLYRVLEDLYKNERPEFFDFGSGDSEYKQIFGNENYEEVNLFLIRKTPKMAAARAAFESLKSLDSAARRVLDKTGLREKVRHILRKTPAKQASAASDSEADA